MLPYNAKNLYPVQSSPDPIRCPVAPGVHGMKKEARFPWWGLGYFSILLLIDLHVSPLFPKAATLSQLSFPAGCSGPFLPLEDALGEPRGFMWRGASAVLSWWCSAAAAMSKRLLVSAGRGSAPRFHRQGVNSSGRKRGVLGCAYCLQVGVWFMGTRCRRGCSNRMGMQGRVPCEVQRQCPAGWQGWNHLEGFLQERRRPRGMGERMP